MGIVISVVIATPVVMPFRMQLCLHLSCAVVASGGKVSEASTILRFVARSCPQCGLYGGGPLESAQVSLSRHCC